jgi:hypothetical protein
MYERLSEALKGARMTLRTNARIAGFTYFLYLAAGIASLILSGRAIRGEGIAAKLASIAQHATEVRFLVVLSLITSLSALALGVTLYAITRRQDPDLAMLGLSCRVLESVADGIPVLALLWLATATATNELDTGAAHVLGAFLLRAGGGTGFFFFAVGSMLFSWLLLRGRMIPVALARLGVFASVLLVLILPLQLSGLLGSVDWFGPVTWLISLPMLVFELTLALWFIVKGAAMPPTRQSPAYAP